MANKSILTSFSKVTQVEQSYYSPVALLPAPSNLPVSTMYCFLGSVDAWPDDELPPSPRQDQKYLKEVFKNMFAVKKFQANDIIPVIQRIDWKNGDVYDYYRDDVDMFELDINGNLVKSFYVKNRYDQVFKCLWNNNAALSTAEPFFQPGTYNVNKIFNGSDGYKWKYMYTIDGGIKRKFMDTIWMPVTVKANTLNPLGSSAGCGDIECINIINTGSGYDAANSQITVSISGDGTGAAAVVSMNDDKIADIIITNAGSNYSYANVSIISDVGANATAIAPVSPVGGHGFDPLSELGCSRLMFTAEFNGSENGYIPTNMPYHQVGILINPVSLESNPKAANNNIYKLSTDLIVAPGFSDYAIGEMVYQGTSLANATFKGKVLSFDSAANVIKLINTNGTPSADAPVFGNNTRTTRTVLNISTPDFVIFSGYITQIQNRSEIQRSSDGIEQFRFVLGY